MHPQQILLTPGSLTDRSADSTVLGGDGATMHRRSEHARGRRVSRRKLRIALYSHDTMGIGHMRRNLLIAQALMQSWRAASSLVVAGAREAAAMTMPASVDCLTLPAFRKQPCGCYRSRGLRVPFEELVRIRARTIHAAIEAYEPDVFIVDKVPRGVGGELEPALEALRRHARTKCVLGLREVLDSSDHVRCEWSESRGNEAVERYYDAVWVYGDPQICDPVGEYGFSADTVGKVRYTGYFDQRIRIKWTGPKPENPLAGLGFPPGRLALCMVGGGQDGAPVAQAFTEAAMASGMNAVVLTGPFMPARVRQQLQRLAAGAARLRVIEFIAEPSLLLSAADRVVAMGGYNTVTEILSFGKRALIVPRTAPRLEQLIRARRLSDLGLIDLLLPEELTSRAIARWLANPLEPVASARDRIDFNGLARLPELLAGVLRNGSREACDALRTEN
jgi:predicted glycosyltransferase